MARRTPENLVMPRSPSAYQEVPFSSELPPQPLAAHTDLLWTSPEGVSGINKQRVTGRFSTRDLSTIQQFEALHLRAERGGPLWVDCVCACLEECVCVGVLGPF